MAVQVPAGESAATAERARMKRSSATSAVGRTALAHAPAKPGVRERRLVALLVLVDLVAMSLSRWLFTGSYPKYARDIPRGDRRRMLKRILEAMLKDEALEMQLRSLEREQREIEWRLRELENALRERGRGLPCCDGLDASLGPSVVPATEAIRGALPHLVEAVLRRVVELRDDRDRGNKTARWVDSFREACVSMTPRLIPPVIQAERLDRDLRRLRREADLPSIAALRTRRSARSIGAARLRFWGLTSAT